MTFCLWRCIGLVPWLLRVFIEGDIWFAGERGISAATVGPGLQAELGSWPGGSGWSCLTLDPSQAEKSQICNIFYVHRQSVKAIILDCATLTLASQLLNSDIDHIRIWSLHIYVMCTMSEKINECPQNYCELLSKSKGINHSKLKNFYLFLLKQFVCEYSCVRRVGNKPGICLKNKNKGEEFQFFSTSSFSS